VAEPPARLNLRFAIPLSPVSRSTIYLTFDDGPADSTAAILDALAENGAKATFFQQGRFVTQRDELTRRAHLEGHAVGNHAWSHPQFLDVDEERIEAEMLATSDVIERVTGEAPSLFRPPYGLPWATEETGPEVNARREFVQATAERLGMGIVLWNAHAEDWATGDAAKDARTPGEIADRVIDQAQPRMVVLLHDDLRRTVAAVPRILHVLIDRGYTFEPVPPHVTLI
jgi:peptidoglycan/xylan/chitin deacetylase (PgdA/CDA1 family)